MEAHLQSFQDTTEKKKQFPILPGSQIDISAANISWITHTYSKNVVNLSFTSN